MGLLKNAAKNIIKNVAGYKEIEFKVAGVTFKNGRKTRQALLRAMKWKDEPFDKKVDITFERYDYEGELAISVLANGEQIGNVPKEMVAEFDEKWTGQYLIESWEVLGSGKDAPFGCRIKVLFDK